MREPERLRFDLGLDCVGGEEGRWEIGGGDCSKGRKGSVGGAVVLRGGGRRDDDYSVKGVVICALKDTDDVGWPWWCFPIVGVVDGEFRLSAVVDGLCGVAINLAFAFVDVGTGFGHCQCQSYIDGLACS